MAEAPYAGIPRAGGRMDTDSRSSGYRLQPSILVVDDEEDFADSLALSLRREGYRVLTAPDGPAAIECAARERPDLVLLDLMLPGLSGLDVRRTLRESGRGSWRGWP